MKFEHIELVMLPLEEWKAARIIRFWFKELTCKCIGTIVYTRPFSKDCNMNSTDIIDDSIFMAVQNRYPDAHLFKKDLVWENSYENIERCYTGGRPKTDLTIRMTPAIDPDMMPKFVGKTIYAYDIHLNIFLDYIGDSKNIPSDIFVTKSFPYEDDIVFSRECANVLSL